jgi:hypothetical protein
MMKREFLVLVVAMVAFIVLILSSKVLRTIIREAVLRPKQPCDIHVGGRRVMVVHHDDKGEKEV